MIKLRVRLVIIKDQKVLVTYDKEDNYYFFPGGKVEERESLVETINREVSEEFGNKYKFIYEKILYLRDFIDEEQHSFEIFVKGSLSDYEGLEGLIDPEFEGRKYLTWIDIDNLPKNLYPEFMHSKLLDIVNGKDTGDIYVGNI